MNMHRTTLICIVVISMVQTTEDISTLSASRMRIAPPAAKASARFIAGPARETIMSPRRRG